MKKFLNVIPEVNEFNIKDGEFTIPANGNLVRYIKKAIDPSIKGEEAYRLEITEKLIKISASTNCGLYRGFQTVKQLAGTNVNGKIPCVTVNDSPRFSYRAFMLDSCRHMQTVQEIKRMVDIAALFKLNTMHWHISDDQGFRFESRKYPLLNEIGSYRDADDFGNKHIDAVYGGFYTREEMQDIIGYCKSKYIEVIPELDIPGHVTALIAAYPELSCEGKKIPVYTKNGISADILCAGKESTYDFVYNLLDEICEVFNSEYIHIGGDEAPKVKWYQCENCKKAIAENGLKNAEELQGLFTAKVTEYLKSKGKKAIVWNDSLKSGKVSADTTVQFWTGDKKSAVNHANCGGALINSDFFRYYADYPYGMTPLRKTYKYEPIFPKITEENASNLIGTEMPIWTEYICSEKRMHYLAIPRICAVAETAWSNKDKKNYRLFRKKMKKILPILDRSEISYAPKKDWDMHPARAIADELKFFSRAKNKEAMQILKENKTKEKELEKEFLSSKTQK